MVDTARRRSAKPAASLSLRDRAYAEIKRRINRLEYRPGAYLNEAQVSNELGLGRTPVHQALGRLMLEGIVRVMPRKGVIVQPISLDEVLQIIDVRLINEPHCVALAVERATSHDIAEMRRIMHDANALTRIRDREGLMNLDRSFHNLISRAAKNPVLADVLRSLHERSLRFWFLSLGDDLHLRRVNDEHRAILHGIAARDRNAAVNAMVAHINLFRDNIMRSV